MNAESFCEHFATFAEARDGVTRLREMILQLAIQGRLVSQEPMDEPASSLVDQIAKFKQVATGRPIKIVLRDSKDLGFPLRNGWVATSFGDIMLSRDGERIPVSREIREGRKGPYDYYGASGIIDCIDDFLFDKPLLLIGEDGANLINRSTPIAFIAQGKYWVNNHAHVLDGISVDFLRYIELYINAIDLKPFVTGTAQPKMNQAKMNSIPIALPPLAEQRRIVAKVDQLLDLCDELESRQAARREARQRLVEATLDHVVSCRSTADFPSHVRRLRDHFDSLFDTPTTIPQLRQAILQLAVQGQLVPQDPNDEPAAFLRKKLAKQAIELQEAGRATRPKPLPAIEKADWPFDPPTNWEWVRFGELAAEVEYGTSQKASEIGGDVPVLRMNAIRDGKVILEESKFVSSTIDDLPRLYLKNGDILFNRTNSFELVGKSGVFNGPDDKYTFASYLIRGCLLPELSPDFVVMAMNANYFRKTQIEPEVTQQCGQANFNGTKWRNSLIPLPPVAEQKRIVSRVTELLSHCDILESKLTLAESANTELLSAAVHHLQSS